MCAKIKLIALLPMSRDGYEKDFQREESRQEFSELLSNSFKSFTVPHTEDLNKTDCREIQYKLAGDFIVGTVKFL